MIVEVAFTAVVALDQGTKALIVGALHPGGALLRQPFGIRICHLRNPRNPGGIAVSPSRLLAIWIFMGSVLPLLLAASGSLDTIGTQIGLGVVLGATLSNLIDRAARGVVIDFIDLHVWPVFNVADAGIVLGTSLLLWSAVR